MDRKDFLVKGCAICGAAALSTYLASCLKTSNGSFYFSVNLADPANAALDTVGGYVEQNNAIVISTGSGFKAFSLYCSHNQQCLVNYVSSAQQFRCSCEGGVFNGNGAVVSGPPTTSLQKLTVSRTGNLLTISS